MLNSYLQLRSSISLLFILLTSLTFSQNSDSVASDTTEYSFTKSPTGALFRSAVLPGWGQFYNESYYKVPVIAGLAAWFGYNYFSNNNLYNDYKTLYQNTGNRLYYLNREFYRDQRDNFAIYLGILYVANLIDAYVDAHLFDFNVEEDFYRPGNFYHVRMKIYF